MKKIIFFLCAIFTSHIQSQINPVATYSGNGNDQIVTGSGLLNSYKSVSGITKDSHGNIFVVDFSANNIRKITPTGNSTIFAGSELGHPGIDNGNGTNARFYEPYDIVADANDNLYVTDRRSNRIRKITPSGDVTTIAGNSMGFLVNGVPSNFNQPQGIDIMPNGELIVADRGNRIIRRLTTSGTHVAYYGDPFNLGYVNGDLSVAKFAEPMDVRAVSNTEFYIAESTYIRKIDLTANTLTVFAGSGYIGGTDGALLSASFNGASSIEYDGSSLYVADRSGHKIRKISNGQVTTVTGVAESGFRDGNSTFARFNTPSALFFVAPNKLYVADWYNRRVRKISLGDYCGSSATTITGTNGTNTIGMIDEGRADTHCTVSFNYFDANAKWFKFTPTQSGELSVTSRTAQNPLNTNTFLTIYADPNGLCYGLQCKVSSDNYSSTDLRSEINKLEVIQGVNYYIVWSDIYTDDFQNANFSYTFEPKTCFKPINFNTSQPSTENTIYLSWQNSTIVGTNILAYELEIGLPGFVPGTGNHIQTKTVTTLSTSFTGLNPGTAYQIYIRAKCGANDFSSWLGSNQIFTEFVSISSPFSENFDTQSSFQLAGFITSGPVNTQFQNYPVTNSANRIAYNDEFTHSGSQSVFSEMRTGSASQAYLFTRKLNLSTGNSYNLTYYARTKTSSGVTMAGTLANIVTPNTNYLTESNHIILNTRSINTIGNGFIEIQSTFIPSVNGEYRFGVKNNGLYSGPLDSKATLYLDSFILSSVLSVDNFNESSFSLYPNPVLDHITLQNPENIQIKNYSVIDMNGRVLISKPYSVSNEVIDLTSLSKGIYFIQLDSEKGTLTKKIIKE
jgi:sugar lactone lactonase YvrE